MTAETIAKAVGGRKAGGGWTARCPAHDDQTSSLSIRSADDDNPNGSRELSPGVFVMKCWSPRDRGPA